MWRWWRNSEKRSLSLFLSPSLQQGAEGSEVESKSSGLTKLRTYRRRNIRVVPIFPWETSGDAHELSVYMRRLEVQKVQELRLEEVQDPEDKAAAKTGRKKNHRITRWTRGIWNMVCSLS